jgi:DNA-binding IclR family transcriptional regulator
MAEELKDRPAQSTDTTQGTVSRALSLLALLADAGGSVTVKYVSEQMGLAPSTAHRLLQLLKKEGYVEAAAEGRHYSIGPSFYRVSAKVVASVSAVSIAQPCLNQLADLFNETVVFGQFMRNERALAFSARADGQQRLKYQIDMNTPLSLVWGASGKAVLAYLPEDLAKEILANEGHSPAANTAPPSWSSLSVALEQIRAKGYAVSESEKLQDARGIAAPVFGPKGIVGCICLTSPISRMPHASIEAIGAEIAARCIELSRALGASNI